MNGQIVSTNYLNDYGFACVNGYKGTFYEYMQNRYKGYCATCERCDIEPLPYEQWLVTSKA